MSFGLSVGDFLAVIELANLAASLLPSRETGGVVMPDTPGDTAVAKPPFSSPAETHHAYRSLALRLR
jgi:hypothetical protein